MRSESAAQRRRADRLVRRSAAPGWYILGHPTSLSEACGCGLFEGPDAVPVPVYGEGRLLAERVGEVLDKDDFQAINRVERIAITKAREAAGPAPIRDFRSEGPEFLLTNRT